MSHPRRPGRWNPHIRRSLTQDALWEATSVTVQEVLGISGERAYKYQEALFEGACRAAGLPIVYEDVSSDDPGPWTCGGQICIGMPCTCCDFEDLEDEGGA